MESNSNSAPPRTGLESLEGVREIGSVVTLGGSSVLAPTSNVLTLTGESVVEVMISVVVKVAWEKIGGGNGAVVIGGELTGSGGAIAEEV